MKPYKASLSYKLSSMWKALKSAELKKNWEGNWFIVFPHSIEADEWFWLFWIVLRRRIVCYGQYENAYQLW